MRYFLLNKGEEYYILKSGRLTIIEQAVCQAAAPLASIATNDEEKAYRHLMAIAALHHIKKKQHHNEH